jgi:hypothetical protein
MRPSTPGASNWYDNEQLHAPRRPCRLRPSITLELESVVEEGIVRSDTCAHWFDVAEPVLLPRRGGSHSRNRQKWLAALAERMTRLLHDMTLIEVPWTAE